MPTSLLFRKFFTQKKEHTDVDGDDGNGDPYGTERVGNEEKTDDDHAHDGQGIVLDRRLQNDIQLEIASNFVT